MEDVPNTVRAESQVTAESSPFRDGICLLCDLTEGAWGKERGDMKRNRGEVPED